MSYQVLARKWRPKKFKELMGQEHVVTVLVNALEQQRLHHAYLFTGTRGVGKTTIARIFAKSLNCQTGITTEPCGECDTCKDIDLGRFVDLIEIDAASKTKVDDTREILDNVQYAPTSGRYKVYLIDEVHMLSRSSFNALLKTLEEPPEHVKFILATTDPQKLPVTVLSRCLQFHLKALTVTQIEQQLNIILAAEQVNADKGAVNLLAKAARGSMRDSLSLTDQSIAQGSGNITLSNVQQMLGGVDQNWVYKILIALIKQDAQQLMSLSLNIASYSPSYSRLMAELIQLLHQIAMVQIVDKHFDLSPEQEVLLHKFAQAMSPEDVQLYYQIVLNGRKDLPYAADEQAAFDMVLLRLLAFKPVKNISEISKSDQQKYLQANTSASASASVETVETVDFDDVELAETLEKTEVTVPELARTPTTPAINNSSHTNEDNNSVVHTNEQAVEQQLFDEMASIEAQAAEQQNFQPEHIESLNSQQEYFSQEPVNQVNNESYSPNPVEQTPSSTVNEYNEPLQPVEVQQAQPLTNEPQTPPVNFTSPVESALATRNILRSRKKEMLANAKKSNDATVRHTSEKDNDAPVKEEPTFEPIEMVIDEPYRPDLIDPSKIKSANQVDKWSNMIDSMALGARIRQIAIHATICETSTDDHLILLLDQSTKHLKTDTAVEQLTQSLSTFLKKPITVEINEVEVTQADPYKIQSDINDKRYEYAVKLLKEDEIVVALQQNFQAQLNESTIQAL